MAAGKEAAGPGWRVRRLEGCADMERAAGLAPTSFRQTVFFKVFTEIFRR